MIQTPINWCLRLKFADWIGRIKFGRIKLYMMSERAFAEMVKLPKRSS